LGHGCACDAYRTFAIEPSGDVVVHAIQQALDGSYLSARDIQYVSAHGSSSPQLDRRETLIMKKAFADYAYDLPFSSIKAVLGHAMGTSGAFQVASAALSFYHDLLPPTHNFEEPDPECDLDYIPNIPRAARHQNCLISNFAYGGMSSFLVVKRSEAFLPCQLSDDPENSEVR
jgi:3-oxoacyl-(acyl-carrier-protein) synthase